MKRQIIKTREALTHAISKEIRSNAYWAGLKDGPYYLVTSKHDVMISKEVEKAIMTLPEGHLLVTASEGITAEARELVAGVAGVCLTKGQFEWTDASAKECAR